LHTVLLLDADSRVGTACLQSLGPAGHRVHVAVRRLGAPAERSRWCRRVHLQPAAEPVDAGVAWLVELDARFGFALVVPTTEASLRWLRALPEDHPVRRKAVLPSNDALDAALDKSRTAAIARALGLPVPATRELAQCARDVPLPDDVRRPPARWPVVLKPVRSKVVRGGKLASLAVAVVHDEEARALTLGAWLPDTPVLEQAWVPGRGVGVEVLYEHGRMAWHFVHERLHEWPLTGGASTLRRAAGPEPALVEMTRRLLDHLQWHGVAMVEWRRDAGGVVHLMEINPRLWGSLPLTIAAGVPIPLGLLSLATGEALGPARGWRVGVTARNLSNDIQWFIDNLRADRRDPMLLTSSPWRAALGWLRVLTGRETWDGWSWRDAAIAREELSHLVHKRFAGIAERVARRAAQSRARKHHATLARDAGPLARPVGSVLFLCLGNLCRSPFAEVAAAQRLAGMRIASAGFLSHDGRPSPPHVVQTARSLGVDLSLARAHRVTPAQVAQADLIVCMDLSHLERMASEFPQAMGKTTLLGLFRPGGAVEMRDPYDLSPAATRDVFVEMLAAIDALAAQAPRAATAAGANVTPA
jgi:protein-tyrosine-phosphatase/predicted ATP-grasp superfamily ATP-dependent carboligase